MFHKNGVPTLHKADDLKRHDISRCVGGRWVASRPLGFQGLYLMRRLKLAWLVFVGRYDALKWDSQ